MKLNFNSKQVVFLALFFLAALASMRLNIIPVYGTTDQFVSSFHFFAPIAGGFVGLVPAVLTVFAAEIVDFIIQQKSVTLTRVLLLFPILVGVWFFSRHKLQSGLLVSALGIALWLLHPIGREVWFYSLLFLVPLVGGMFQNLAGRSFGAAYSAFVAGQVLWLYFVPTTAANWVSWIPVVVFERTAFAIGIASSYVLFNTLLARVPTVLPVRIDPRYDLIAIMRKAHIG